MKPKEIKREEAEARQVRYANMSDTEKLEQIKNRRGKSAKEKAKIDKRKEE